MRRPIIIFALLTTLFIPACRKQDGPAGARVDEKEPRSSPITNASPQASSGAGAPGEGVIDAAGAPTGEQARSPLPPPTGPVSDFAKVIDEQSKIRLETSLLKLKQESDVEFAVVTVETTGEQSTFDYTMAVARGWGIGSNSQSRKGLILLVAINDRRWEIRWTRSLEDTLKEGIADELKTQMTASFRQGKYGEGIWKGVQAVLRKLSDKGVPAVQK